MNPVRVTLEREAQGRALHVGRTEDRRGYADRGDHSGVARVPLIGYRLLDHPRPCSPLERRIGVRRRAKYWRCKSSARRRAGRTVVSPSPRRAGARLQGRARGPAGTVVPATCRGSSRSCAASGRRNQPLQSLCGSRTLPRGRDRGGRSRAGARCLRIEPPRRRDDNAGRARTGVRTARRPPGRRSDAVRDRRGAATRRSARMGEGPCADRAGADPDGECLHGAAARRPRLVPRANRARPPELCRCTPQQGAPHAIEGGLVETDQLHMALLARAARPAVRLRVAFAGGRAVDVPLHRGVSLAPVASIATMTRPLTVTALDAAGTLSPSCSAGRRLTGRRAGRTHRPRSPSSSRRCRRPR